MAAKRVRYREDQTLKQRDLQDEQVYQIAMRRRHNIAQHSWGIVQGLSLIEITEAIRVMPGVAIDGYGRELIVAQMLTLDDTAFNNFFGNPNAAPASFYIDVWLTYCLRQIKIGENGAGTRDTEEALLKLACNTSSVAVDPNYPWEVPDSDIDFAPYREPIDDAEKEWPVYLGKIHVDRSGDLLSVTVLDSKLRYAALVGASLATPWGDQWLTMGTEALGANRRVSITLRDKQGQSIERMVLGDDGETRLVGSVIVPPSLGDGDSGSFSLLGSGDLPSLGGGIDFSTIVTKPELAAPWQMYHTKTTKVISGQELPVDQLRVETFNPGEDGDPARHEMVIGSRLEDGSMSPIMSVRSNNNVVLDANLLVEGQLVEGEIPLDFNDERFRDEMLSRWTKGLTLAGTEVDAYYELPRSVTLLNQADEETNPIIPEPIYNGKIAVTFGLKIKHDNLENKNEVPIVAVIGEFRDANRNVVNTVELENLPFRPIQPEPPDNVFVTKVSTVMDAINPLTLTLRVVSIGAAQNRMEKTANKLVKGDLPFDVAIDNPTSDPNSINYEIVINHNGGDDRRMKLLAVISELTNNDGVLIRSVVPDPIPEDILCKATAIDCTQQISIPSSIIIDTSTVKTLTVRVIAVDTDSVRMKVEKSAIVEEIG